MISLRRVSASEEEERRCHNWWVKVLDRAHRDASGNLAEAMVDRGSCCRYYSRVLEANSHWVPWDLAFLHIPPMSKELGKEGHNIHNQDLTRWKPPFILAK